MGGFPGLKALVTRDHDSPMGLGQGPGAGQLAVLTEPCRVLPAQAAATRTAL